MDEFWFPTNLPPTTVTKLTVTLESIGGDGQAAYVLGDARGRLDNRSKRKGDFVIPKANLSQYSEKATQRGLENLAPPAGRPSWAATLGRHRNDIAGTASAPQARTEASCALSSGSSECVCRRQLDLCREWEAHLDEPSPLLHL